MRRAFHAIDRNNDGHVSWDELRGIVDSFAMPLSDNAFVGLMSRFVSPSTGLLYFKFSNSKCICRFGVQPADSLPYDVFLRKFQGTDPGQVLPIKPSHRYEELSLPYLSSSGSKSNCFTRIVFRYNPVMESTEEMSADGIMTLLQSKVSGSHDSIHKAFLRFDDVLHAPWCFAVLEECILWTCLQNKDGFISHSELRKVIETFTFRLTNDQFLEVLSRLDPTNKGRISFKEFIGHFGNKEDAVGSLSISTVTSYMVTDWLHA